MRVGHQYSNMIDGKPLRWTVAEVIVFASDKRDPDRSTPHWHEIELVRTEQGNFILRRERRDVVKNFYHPNAKFWVFEELQQVAQELDPSDLLDMMVLGKSGLIEMVATEI